MAEALNTVGQKSLTKSRGQHDALLKYEQLIRSLKGQIIYVKTLEEGEICYWAVQNNGK